MSEERGSSNERVAAAVLGAGAVYGIVLWLAAYDDPARTGSAKTWVALMGVVAGVGLFWALAVAAGLFRGQDWARGGARATGMGTGVVSLIWTIDTARRAVSSTTAGGDVVPPVLFLLVAATLVALVGRPASRSRATEHIGKPG